MNEDKPNFDYDFLEQFELMFKPKMLLDYIQEEKIICNKCKGFKSIKFGEKQITIKCKCGVGIIYPKREERGNAYFYRWVSSVEYKKSRNECR